MLVSERVETLFDLDTLDRPASRPQAASGARRRSRVSLTVHEDIAPLEAEWRAFQERADCTVFQSYEWLSTWLRHVGPHHVVRPAIVVGRDRGGAIEFILPFAVEGGAIRRLRWLASDLCDYNAPLLAADFAARFDGPALVAMCREVEELLAGNPRLRHDAIELTKMPAMVGSQANPFVRLPVSVHPSGAYLTALTGDWEGFYFEKRSSATRRRDRTKRKRLAEMGALGFVTADAGDIDATLAVLMEQKTKAFARMGVPNLFANPGYADFFRSIATDPATRDIVHVSRLDVGETPAATNLGLIFRGRYYHILASYDEGPVSKFGPGMAHLHDLMGHAIARGCREYDFTIGDEGYKRDWADTELVLYDYYGAITWRGLALTVPSVLIARAKRFVKRSPQLFELAQRVRARLGGGARKGDAAPAQDAE
jgi:CelD/BcsL family acetyltransferase involved in cellulose biosynthesis